MLFDQFIIYNSDFSSSNFEEVEKHIVNSFTMDVKVLLNSCLGSVLADFSAQNNDLYSEFYNEYEGTPYIQIVFPNPVNMAEIHPILAELSSILSRITVSKYYSVLSEGEQILFVCMD